MKSQPGADFHEPATSPETRSLRAILLVEDEALVGLMMRELLESMGYSVVGPVGNLPEALRAASGHEFAGAILDVNLNGEVVYSLAELLDSRAVPYLFVTGHSRDQIDPRFTGAPVLQKPVMPETLEAGIRKITAARPQNLATACAGI